MKFFTPSFFQLRKVGLILVAVFAMSAGIFAQNATNGGQIAANQTICPGETPNPFTSNAPASGGDSNLAIEYLWMVGSTASFPNGFSNAPGINNGETYTPPAVGTTSYFIRCARRTGYTEFQAESNIVVVNVLGSPTAIINGAPSQIYTGGSVTLDAAFAGNSSYAWDFNGDGFAECFTQTCSYTYSFPGVYNATLTVTNANGCVAITTVQITVLAPTASTLVDPCCGPGSIPTPTAFYSSDYITIYSNPGQTWFYTNTGNTVYNANLQPIPNGTQFTEVQPGVYVLPLWFNSNIGGWMGSATNGSTTIPAGPGNNGVNCLCVNPLPVDLMSFEATTVGTDVELKWATASESNNSHFELERSLDGTRFETITQVEGAGNTSDVQTYSFMDKSAFEGTNYYRLKQVDFDGTEEFFTVVTAKIETGQAVLHVLPNPVQDIARVRLEATISDNATYNLINATGQLVKSVRVTNVGSIQEIDMTNLEAGIYFLNVVDGSQERIFQKIIKQ